MVNHALDYWVECLVSGCLVSRAGYEFPLDSDWFLDRFSQSSPQAVATLLPTLSREKRIKKKKRVPKKRIRPGWQNPSYITGCRYHEVERALGFIEKLYPIG